MPLYSFKNYKLFALLNNNKLYSESLNNTIELYDLSYYTMRDNERM